jgi:PAS domain S-box-containing protein
MKQKNDGKVDDALRRRVAELEVLLARQEKTEQELRETKDRLARAQKQAKLTYWRYSFELQDLTYTDEDPWDIFGLPSDKLPRTPEDMLALTHPDDRDHLAKAYEAADAGPSDFKVEYRIRRPDGEFRFIREIGEVEYDGEGRAVAHVGSVQDITELKQTEAALRDAQESLLRKERLATLGQLTATVGHELRNPLGAIRSATDAIQRLIVGEDPRLIRAIELLDRSQNRCNAVIADLLNLAQMWKPNLQTGNLDGWLGELLDDYDLPSPVKLNRNLDCGATVAFDRDRLGRAVRNVIENACHAMISETEEDSEAKDLQMTVATGKADGRLEMSVRDSGQGIAPEHRAKVFEPLFTTKSFGTGLGLHIVKETLEGHGGGVEIDSEVGRGTKVTLWLPLQAASVGDTSPPTRVS